MYRRLNINRLSFMHRHVRLINAFKYKGAGLLPYPCGLMSSWRCRL